MGYILPIRHFEQEQYVIRDIASQQKMYRKEEVRAIPKVSNTMEYRQLSNEENVPRKSTEIKPKMHENQASREKIIAQLTGKGTHFHAFI